MPAASPAAPVAAPKLNVNAKTSGKEGAPPRAGESEPQHMRALAYANRVRLARASLKRSVKAGDLAVSAVVRECPWEAESMTIAELLRSQRRWGRTRARKFLSPLALNENRTLGRMTSRQRDLLAAALDTKSRSGRRH